MRDLFTHDEDEFFDGISKNVNTGFKAALILAIASAIGGFGFLGVVTYLVWNLFNK